jgi:hypothetical protein
MTVSPLQPLDDIRMGFVKIIMCHAIIVSPWRG